MITLSGNLVEILTGTVGLLIVLNLAQLIAARRLAGQLKRLTRLLRATDRGSLEEFIDTYKANIESIHRRLEDTSAWCKNIEETLARCTRTPVMLRYRALEGMGGDQSYSCALLDGRGDGVVFTSLYSQHSSYNYGKPVRQGRSDYPLSTEEQHVVGQVLQAGSGK